jgi:hypothetical protein
MKGMIWNAMTELVDFSLHIYDAFYSDLKPAANVTDSRPKAIEF